jgi:hypothetical protein
VPTKVLALKAANQFPGENGLVKTNAVVQLVKKWLKIVNVTKLPPLHQFTLQLHHHSVLTKLAAPELWVNNGTTLVMLATLALVSKTD